MFKKKIFALSAATAVAGMTLMLGTAGIATAATPGPNLPNSSYGFDGNANLVVGGGSTTLYKIGQGFAALYDSTAGCSTNNASYNAAGSSPVAYPQASPAFGQCSPTTPQSYAGVEAGGDFDGDNISIAAAVGSSTGIASLNGSHSGTAGTYAYEGTNADIPTTGDPNVQNGLSNGFGTVDFALSSRAAKTSNGNCNLANPTSGAAGDELQCDTFWGVAADGVEVFTFGSTVAGSTDSTSLQSWAGALTGTDLYNIWECHYTTWGALPEYAAAVAAGDPVPPSGAPIVPWSMNSNSGTYADFNNYVSANDGSQTFTMDDQAAYYNGGTSADPTPPTGKCGRELSTTGNPLPLENDIKPLLNDVQNNQGGLSTDPMSTNNPANWIWAGSFGLLTAYPYLSQPSLFGNQYNTTPAPVAGKLPSTSAILAGTYPIPRILSVVTAKTDATCPAGDTTNPCNLSGGPTNDNGTTDLNVAGGTSGKSGAVREFVRFLCRNKAESQFTVGTTTSGSPTDPFTGATAYNEIGAVISNSGFTLPPVATRSTGSNCDVQGIG